MRKTVYDVQLLHRLWADETLQHREIALRLGVSQSFLGRLKLRHKLPKRDPPQCRTPYDPTPEEIAERAAECRERHFATRRCESEEASSSRSSRARRRELTGSA